MGNQLTYYEIHIADDDISVNVTNTEKFIKKRKEYTLFNRKLMDMSFLIKHEIQNSSYSGSYDR